MGGNEIIHVDQAGKTNAVGVNITAGNALSANSVTNAAGSTITNAGILTTATGTANVGTLNTTNQLYGGLTNSGTTAW